MGILPGIPEKRDLRIRHCRELTRGLMIRPETADDPGLYIRRQQRRHDQLIHRIIDDGKSADLPGIFFISQIQKFFP